MTTFDNRSPLLRTLRNVVARVRNPRPVAATHWAVDNEYIEAVLKAPRARPEKDFGPQARAHFDDPAELYRIAAGYCYVGLLEKACALYERIVELNPGWIDILDPHARALWALHQYDEATKLWVLFLEKRKNIRQKIGIPLNFYTIDDAFTASFGNFCLFYPMDQYGYLTDVDEFYYHKTPLPECKGSLSPNKALCNFVFERIKDSIPHEILSLLAQDDYVTRLPFYCATDINRRPIHFHPAFAQKMLALNREGKLARIRFEPEQIGACTRNLARMGVDPNRPIVCIHVRESGYWGRTGDRSHSTKNADITTYIPAIQLLTNNGYQVVRLGDSTMRPLPALESVFDYALSEYKNDFLDVYLLANSAFLMCTSSGPFAVASIFGVPLLGTNWFPIHTTPFQPRDLVLLKKLKNKGSGRLLSIKEMLDLGYAEFSYYYLERNDLEVVDNTPQELVGATTEMLERLHAERSSGPANQEPDLSMLSRFYGKVIFSEAQFARGSI